MAKDIKYKKQGDGKDSWIIREFDDDGNLISTDIVYTDPAFDSIDISKADISTLTGKQSTDWKIRLGR